MKGESSAEPKSELQDLLESVERNNLDLQVLREQLKATGYDLKERNTLDNTSVEYSPFFRKGAAGVASSELIVSQEFDFPTLYVARSKAGKLQLSQQSFQYDVECRDILLAATDEYLKMIRLKKLRMFLERQLEDSEKLLSLYSERLNIGEATSIEINRVRLQVMDLRNELLANEVESENVLNVITSLNGYNPIELSATEYPAWLRPTITSVQLEDYCEVAAADKEIEALQQEERVAAQGWVPKLTLGYRRNTELDEASNGLIVGASFSLFNTQAATKAAKARKAAAEIEMDNVRKRIEAEVTTTHKELDVIEKAMKNYDQTLIDEGERLLMKSVELGNMTAIDYLSEVSVLREKEISFIDLEFEYYKRLCVLYKNRLK